MICYKVYLILPPEESFHEQLLELFGEFPIKFRVRKKAIEIQTLIQSHGGSAEIVRGITCYRVDSHPPRGVYPKSRHRKRLSE